MFGHFFVSTGVVALAEIGDKTQLLALILAAKFRRPVPILLGILAATLASHAAAGLVGVLLSDVLSPTVLNWAMVVSFPLMAIWILIPDRPGEESRLSTGRFGVFAAAAISIFLAEIGDKTQVATVALAAQFHDFFGVVVGTTCGMLIANVPAVLLGQKFADRLPARLVQAVAALILVVLGGLALRAALLGTSPGL